jgi:hypothetical protein
MERTKQLHWEHIAQSFGAAAARPAGAGTSLPASEKMAGLQAF